MAPNSDRYLLGNGTDRVSMFYDGRVKVWSRHHLWEIRDSGRHNTLGEFVRIGVGRPLKEPAPIGVRHALSFSTSIDPSRGDAEAATVTADNGTFVVFHHDGSITVGNDGRDIEETVNLGRDNLAGGPSGRGGSVMVFFAGSNPPLVARKGDHHLHIPEGKRRTRGRYAGESENFEGKIGPRTMLN